jgi:hypothetical protein
MESMPPEPANDEAQLREELVAYLDGELDAEQSRRIEQRAAVEPDARRMLEELDRTWHMLDQLDAPATSEDFTCTTLEMVAVAAADDAQKAKAQRPRRRLRAALWVVAGLLGAAAVGAAAVGLMIASNAIPDPNAQLLQDLPILENYDQYREIDSIEFLRALNEEKLFTEDADASPLGGPRAVETPSQRRRRVEAMSAEQLGELFHSEQQFHDLSPQDRQQIRTLHDQIEGASDREKLLATMNRYCKWLRTLPSFRHEKLSDKNGLATVDDRVKTVKEFMANQGPSKDIRLDAKTRQVLVAWLDRYTTDHRARFTEGKDPRSPGGSPSLPPDRQQRILRVTALGRWQNGGPNGPMPILDQERARLLEGLSPELRAKLEAKTPAEQARTITDLLSKTATLELDDELRVFLDTLDPEKRDELMSLPTDEMFNKLNEEYLLHLRQLTPPKPSPGGAAKKRGRGPGSSPGPGSGPGFGPGLGFGSGPSFGSGSGPGFAPGPGSRGPDAGPRGPDASRRPDKKNPSVGKDLKGVPEAKAEKPPVEKGISDGAPPARPVGEKTIDKPLVKQPGAEGGTAED